MVSALKKTNKKGFTLVELVIVIAILAILAAIAIPTVTSVIDTANQNVDKANAQTVELALKSSYAEATAKTWIPDTDKDGGTTGTIITDPDSITVAQALQHSGLGTDLPALKKTGNSWKYVNGKVNVDGTGTALTKAITLEAILGVS